ncbi:MAG TPA: hypothetical protein VFK69_12450 [Candidatus Eisenbacteria bacterium]|nr:hypothetical protein [Candidatus Eisenbacteria bacterium]
MNRWVVVVPAVLVACAAFVAAARPAMIFEDLRSASSLGIDPSTRAVGMGGAGTAVFWGDVDPWANPALLGGVRGVGYEHDHGDLAGIDLRAGRFVAGGDGVGFATSGRPVHGLGEQRIELHGDIGGTPFSAFERVRAWSVGASLAGVCRAWAQRTGGEPPAFTRHFDVALGYGQNAVDEGTTFGGSSATSGPAVVHDLGVLARTGWDAGRLGARRLRVDGAAGFSSHNVTNAGLQDPFSTRVVPAVRQTRGGIAVRGALAAPVAADDKRAWLVASLQPVVALGLAYDPVWNEAGVSTPTQTANEWGAELAVMNVAFARVGLATSEGTSQSTWGLGAALPLGPYGRAGYEHAHSTGDLPDQTRDRWSAWLDPVAIWHAWR